VTRCSFCSGNLTDVLVHLRGAVDLEEPLITHPRCWYFDGAQGKIGCQSKADTPRHTSLSSKVLRLNTAPLARTSKHNN
jgi:hypothetical protein